MKGTPVTSGRSKYSNRYLVAGLTGLATFLVYLRALSNDFVNWDDGPYVLDNPHIRSFNSHLLRWAFTDFYESNWHPLTWISHAFDYLLWGLNPVGHHLTNSILHSLNAALVVLLAIRLLEAYRSGTEKPGPFSNERSIRIAAAGTALLFGLHPLHVESVAWVAERKDLLCALFFLLSLVSYVKYATGRSQTDALQKADRGHLFFAGKHYFAALIFFSLALMSKPMAVTLPAVLLILDWFPLGRARSRSTWPALFLEKLPFVALAAISAAITIRAQAAGGALSSLDRIPLATRLIVASKSVFAYLAHMVVPVDLIPFYPYPKNAPFLSFEHLVSVALLIGVTAVAIGAAKKHKLLFALWSYYLITLAPVLGIIQVGGQAMADRYTYLPSLAPFLGIGVGAAKIWEQAERAQTHRLLLKQACILAAGSALVVLSVLTIRQIGIWKNGLALWNYEIKKEPAVPRAYNNRGLVYEQRGSFDLAIRDFETAIALDPLFTTAYNNRGMVFGKMGLYDKAIGDFKTAISLRPSYASAHNNLGVVYAKTGQLDSAFGEFNQTILLDEANGMAYYNRGLIHARSGRAQAAHEDFKKACDLGNEGGCRAAGQ
jgi:hypothetical protein